MEPPQRVSRRSLLRSTLGGGSALLAAYLIGCDGGDATPTPTPAPTLAKPTPQPEPTPTPSVLQWQQLSPSGPLPPPRRDHSLVLGEMPAPRLVLFAGRSGSGDLADLWTFDLASGGWTEVQASPGPAPRHGHNAIWDVATERLVIFGGQQGSTFLNDIWEFDPRSNEWGQLPNSGSGPTPRYGAAAALTFGPADRAGRLLVTHGFTNAGRFDDTWAYGLSMESWTDASPSGQRPVERCLMRGVWDSRSNRLLMFGGQTTGTPFLGDLWALTVAGWQEIVTDLKPLPRTFYAMVFDQQSERLIMFGGNTRDGPTNDLAFFDATTARWLRPVTQGGVPSPRFGHDAVWHPDTRSLLVFGGNDGASDLNDLWELSVPL